MGPTLAGISVDNYGFPATTVGFFALLCGILIIDFLELAYTVRQVNKIRSIGYEELS